MTKKQIYIGLGITAGAAVLYYFWRQRQIALQQAYLLQQQAQQAQSEEGESRFGGGGGGGGAMERAVDSQNVVYSNPLTPTVVAPIVTPTGTVFSKPKIGTLSSKPLSSISTLSGLIPSGITPSVGVGETTGAFTGGTSVGFTGVTTSSSASPSTTTGFKPSVKPFTAKTSMGAINKPIIASK